MSNDKSVPRILQQQPARERDEEQQRAGATDFQSHANARQQQQGGGVEGEGSYSATRNYQRDLKEYLGRADVQADGEAAKPSSDEEARALEEAEREGRSHSKGER